MVACHIFKIFFNPKIFDQVDKSLWFKSQLRHLKENEIGIKYSFKRPCKLLAKKKKLLRASFGVYIILVL